MAQRRTTFSKFIIENLRDHAGQDADLAGLLNDVMTGCKQIAATVARFPLEAPTAAAGAQSDMARTPLERTAHEIMLEACEFAGELTATVSGQADEPLAIPPGYPRGRYLLVFEALDGSSNIDINMTVGTIFSILRAPEDGGEPVAADFLQQGARQVAAGYALYGPVSMLVVTLGDGVHGFTLNREIGAYMLTHPDMQVPPATQEFAVNASNERYWEPPVRRYVEECVAGHAGPRGADFSMRWIASMVAEVHRILIRGGLFMYPRDSRDAGRPRTLRLLCAANPMAMIVERAGGAASTGRDRILDITPSAIDQCVPVFLGSRREVERVAAYHAAYDRGDDHSFNAPLFNTRSLFRTV